MEHMFGVEVLSTACVSGMFIVFCVISLLCVSAVCDQWKVPGMGNCLSLHARGWGIDPPVRELLQIPGGMPKGGGGRW